MPHSPSEAKILTEAYTGMEYGSLRRIPRHPAVVVSPTTRVQDALLQIHQAKADAAVVVDPQSQLPLGILTLQNLVQGIAMEDCGLGEPVVSAMTAAPVTLPADAQVHRATVLMTKHQMQHLVLVEADGRLFNLVSQADIFGLRGGGAEELAAIIAAAVDVEGLARAADEVRARGGELFFAGMGVETLCEWMSSLNDLIAMRVIELIEEEHDLPPLPWCWLVFGSEGRIEQTFATDQDNGLIFLPADEQGNDRLRQTFLPFAQAVNRALDTCGFTLCKGDIMAGNPEWCLSLGEWQQKFDTWMSTPDPKALLNSTIFFDFRPLYGRYELADALRTWLSPRSPSRPLFLRAMAEEALTCQPPLGWIGNFVYDGGKKHPHTINLKLRGSRPFVDAARVWSLAQGVWATNTGERLRVTAKALRRTPKDVAAATEAFYLIQRFRIQQQLESDHLDAKNRLDPSSLNDLNQLMLKYAFKQGKRLQQWLEMDYQL